MAELQRGMPRMKNVVLIACFKVRWQTIGSAAGWPPVGGRNLAYDMTPAPGVAVPKMKFVPSP